MKKYLTLITAMILVIGPGCANFEKNSYRTIASTATTVDKAMMGWGDFVKAGLATPEGQANVKAKYQSYQKAMGIAEAGILTWKMDQGSDQKKKDAEVAIDVLSNVASAVVTLIFETQRK